MPLSFPHMYVFDLVFQPYATLGMFVEVSTSICDVHMTCHAKFGPPIIRPTTEPKQ